LGARTVERHYVDVLEELVDLSDKWYRIAFPVGPSVEFGQRD